MIPFVRIAATSDQIARVLYGLDPLGRVWVYDFQIREGWELLRNPPEDEEYIKFLLKGCQDD